MGPTNPPQPTLGTPINQGSMARLLSLNSVDVCAWCTQPRNNARLIPDGTITGASFLKTDFYVQLIGYGDLTKINIPAGDFGGELDPHGALGDGNPVGGNVTSNVTGADESFTEWMGNDQFCFRVCTNANSTYSAANMCWHELDEMGCSFVMPGNYDFSTFAQRFTGTLPNGGVYTIGDLSTPSAPFSIPTSSNCVTTATISNGINLAAVGTSIVPVTLTTGTTAWTQITPAPGASSGTSKGTTASTTTNSAGQTTTSAKNSGALSLSAVNVQCIP
ncbi:hypothetical protein BJ912DRAFT_1020896 [Pholiota molesta]|nr:hypothetical protein BJ912DRAFT_1020896 [Pholiota molesta]